MSLFFFLKPIYPLRVSGKPKRLRKKRVKVFRIIKKGRTVEAEEIRITKAEIEQKLKRAKSIKAFKLLILMDDD